MQTVVSSDEMRWCDETTIVGGIPGLLLMENAGRSVVELLHEQCGSFSGAHIAVLCGKGNNGGDGFVIARHFSASGAHVSVLLAAAPAEYRGDAKTNLVMLQRLAKDGRNRILLKRATPATLRTLSEPDLIIDALFGTGFSGDVRKPYAALIDWMNQQTSLVVSVDIPSGINGTSGRSFSRAVDASMTVTFGLVKSGLLLNEGREAAGRVYVADIGVPPAVIERGSFKTFLPEQDDVRPLLPQRPFNAHKYSTGKVLVLAGSKGFTGAAALCATAALRSGAGAVTLLTPETVYPVLSKKLSEVIVRPVSATAEGTLSVEALPEIRKHLSWADVVVVGPGLSSTDEVFSIVRTILKEYAGLLLIDADAISAVAAAGINILRTSRASITLTPHVGEFGRLVDRRSDDIEMKRIELARDFAVRTKTTVVLKGAPTATASKDDVVYVNSTGNPGMATAGAGDVLAGMIAGLWAQGMNQQDAAWCGAFVHGLAGDVAEKRMGQRSLVAGDIIEALPEAFRLIETGGTI